MIREETIFRLRVSGTRVVDSWPGGELLIEETGNRRPEVSAEVANWERERPRRLWDPSRRLLACIRGYQRNKKPGLLASAARKYWSLHHRFWTVITQAEIDLNCQIGGGLMIPHPNGIVIHPKAIIGPNCLIFQQVTIGTRQGPGVPRIGGHVDIGAGARVLGSIVVGNHSRIGANSVVITDVLPETTVVGIPARPLQAGGSLTHGLESP